MGEARSQSGWTLSDMTPAGVIHLMAAFDVILS